MAGMTSTGFQSRTLQDILAEIATLEQAQISSTINTSSASVMGQVNGIFAAKIAELWELAKAIYDGLSPDQATGRTLDLVCALTGTTRNPATATTVVASVTLATGTYAAGSLVASINGAPSLRFTNDSAITIAAGPSTVSANFTCPTTGPIVCVAGTLTTIATPVSGWTAVTNATDGTTGKDIESDAALRTRRTSELAAAGSTTVDAIRADILRLATATPASSSTAVISCTVLENATDTTDGNGLPPHSIECIVLGPISPSAGDDQLVANQIYASKAAGIATASAGGTTTTKTVVDAQGYSHSVTFTRPTQKNMYVTVTTVGGAAADVKAAIVAYGATLGAGDDVIATKLGGAIAAVTGVTDYSLLKFDTTVTPANTANYAIAIREIAVFDTSRITVTVT